MDFASLKEQVSNLTLYDIKAGVRKVQNAVMNYTEMEAKVREATNNEPWGASSTLMQEIANGTHNYQLLNEIMPMIYRRFTEKSAEEWRQIYKALQLLEFLIKNGSERVVDDARAHISLLRMLRQFHYIDHNGKDQGINVRNRSQELVKLLSDVDLIRAERKKARANRNKFGGIEGGMGFGGGLSGSRGRYGGFGSESFGGYSGGVYGDGGGFGGNTNDFGDTGRRSSRFEEYDEDEEDSGRRRAASPSRAKKETKAPEPPKPAEEDLVDFGDDEVSAPTSSTAAGKQPAAGNGLDILQSGNADDDEFDDFQSAAPPASTQPAPSTQFASIPPPTSTATTTSSTQFAAPKPVSAAQGANLSGLASLTSATPTPSTSSFMSPISPPASTSSFAQPQQQQQQQQPPKPTGYQAATPNYYTSVSATPSQQPLSSANTRPGLQSTSSFSSTTSSSAGSKPAASKSGEDVFGSLWSAASASAGIQKTTNTNKGPNLASMAKEKSSASIWGAPAASSTTTTTTTTTSTPSPSVSSTSGFAQSQSQQQKPSSAAGGSSALNDLLG
ncbi:hypothetical protein VTN96DRAFT_4137 [Rasamsonia emersonii]|uniref:ENTH domain containing protein n=1 Tax=Rasamsonia emersonii (strain ATCC 16479 / CBS 393.64 / IMI 116815) TaxID=1408163 RepID=A0A0F4YH29_RASE3|nr:ENTH domain containing protein [Rasamsonia emersonii CBS 393.64]KKA16953.1 ENTH domain containing protein [Rasamsonia emersonii CBS 393.64]